MICVYFIISLSYNDIMANIASDTTNISDLPNNTQINQQIPVQQQSNITMSVSPQQQPPQQNQQYQQQMNQMVNGLQQASMQGLTDLQTRDIPITTEQVTQDQQVQPNYIPPSVKEQYIPPQEDVKPPPPPNDMEQYKLPLMAGIIFLIFQMPILKQTLQKNVKQLFKEDGNFNEYGMIVFSGLFAGAFYSSVKMIDVGSLNLTF